MTESSAAYFYDSYVATFLSDLRRDAHQHGAYQLTISLDDRQHDAGASWESAQGAMIHFVGALKPHVFDGTGGLQLLLWLAPESVLGYRLAQRYLRDKPCAALPGDLVGTLPIDQLRRCHAERWSGDQFRPLLESCFDLLTESAPRPDRALHPAVKKAARIIRGLPEKSISAAALAEQVGLSQDRLLHLLKEHLGLPLRPYLQWLRCIDGIRFLMRGQSATEAAIAAGFTDGAHFNRVMRRLISLSPSMLTQNAHIEICLADEK